MTIPVAAFRFYSESAAAVTDVRSMGKELGRVDKGAQGLNLTLGKLAGFISAGAFVAFLKSSADAADQLGKSADRLRITTDGLVGLRTAAAESGSSIAGLDKALDDANKRLGEAIRGTGEARQVIQGLGLDVNELAELGPDKLFERYAVAISSLRTRAEQAAAAQALFGRGGKDLIPILTDGGAAVASAADHVDRFSLALSRVEIKQIEAANDQMARVAQVADAAGQRIAVGLAPLVEFLSNQMLDASGNTRGLQENVERFSAAAIGSFEIVANAAYSLQAAFFGIAAGGARILQGLTFGDVSEAFAASVKDNLAKATEALGRIKSIEEIQKSITESLERSRAAAEASAASTGAFGSNTLGKGGTFEVGAVDFSSREADLQVAFDLESEFLGRRIKAENDAYVERLNAEREFYSNRVTVQNEAQDLFNRITQGGALFEIKLAELKNQTLLQSGASLVGAILTSNKKLAKAKQNFELAQVIWATAKNVAEAFPNFPLMAAAAATGATQAATIRSTQYFEGGVGGGGGVTPGVQLAAPTPSESNAQAPTPQDTQRVVQVIINGNLFSSTETAEWLADQLGRMINDNDKVVISRNSRQAIELQPE
jgi:hypothetical protein